MSEHVTRIVHEGEIEAVACEECGALNVLQAAEDCATCERFRGWLIEAHPEFASLINLKPA